MLTIDHLNVEYYRRGQTVPAVRDFSLTINLGETVGLVGESGSGKSTVALAILRLFRPQEGRITSGQIVFDGKDLLALAEEPMRAIRGKRISMIFQDPFTSLNPVMRVQDQLAEVITAHAGRGETGEGKLKQAARPSALTPLLSVALERVRLEPARTLNSYPHQLSGGQRQRVMIAMALLGQPDLILADEPTTALDVIVQKEILELLFDLQRELNIGILFISHNLPLVARYSQRLAIMKEGKIVELGTTLGILRHPAHPYTKQLWEAVPRFSKN
jgi:ABC-type dipeptide/oligopeptide/nickel transport system ATPase component